VASAAGSRSRAPSPPKPAFILLDEPFAGVDPIAVLDIQRIIRFSQGTRHRCPDHRSQTCARPWVSATAPIINEGAVLASGHPEEIVYNDSVRRVTSARTSGCSLAVFTV